MNSIKALQTQLRATIVEGEKILSCAKREGRALTSHESKRFEEVDATTERLSSEISMALRAEAFERRAADLRNPHQGPIGRAHV